MPRVRETAAAMAEMEARERDVGRAHPDDFTEFLARMAEGKPVSDVHVGVDGEGKFVYRID